MEQIKALFFDVDGTIYSHRTHDFRKSTQETLYKLKEKGYKIGIATSRCRYETLNLPKFYREFPFDAKIFDGGALVLEHGEILEEHPIEKEAIEALITYANAHQIAVRYSTYDLDCLAGFADAKTFDAFFKLYLNMPIKKAYDGEEKVYNMIVYPENEEQGNEIKALLKERCAIVEHSRHILEVTAKNIDKSKGIEHILERWNISLDETMSFGDGANDCKMFKACKYGVAMGNANPKAIASADFVCGHIDEDGLALFCQEHKLI